MMSSASTAGTKYPSISILISSIEVKNGNESERYACAKFALIVAASRSIVSTASLTFTSAPQQSPVHTGSQVAPHVSSG
jgi:hypothetical protein